MRLSELSHGCDVSTWRGHGWLEAFAWKHGTPYAVVALPGGYRVTVPLEL